MVSTAQITAMFIQTIVSFLIPIVLVIYFVIKKKMKWRSFFMGIVVFIIFSQILEKAMHLILIDPSGVRLKFTDNPYIFMLYAGLAAGLFEEFGRFIAFKFWLKKNRSYQDGLSFGIGHAGIEVWLVTTLIGVNTIILAFLVKNGMFDSVAGKATSEEIASLMKGQITETPWWLYIVALFERIPAILLHISATLLVLYGVVTKEIKYVWYAVIYHAFLDFLPALYQAGIITDVWLIEGSILAYAIVAVYIIKRMKEKFHALEK